MDVRPGNATESQKSMLVEIIIACPIIQEVLFKIQSDQNWPNLFFIQNLPILMLPVLGFFGLKIPFLISRTSIKT